MADTYSDYTFYKNEYHGALTEEQYSAQVNKAHAEITARTMGRSDSEMETALKMCECELVDAIDGFAQIPAGISSINNDGYSVSFGTSGRGSTLSQSSEASVYEAICRRWLLVPTNLLLRWV